MAHIQGLNEKLDKRHERRALSPDEMRRILDAARHGVKRYCMTGREREMLYRLAMETGLRWSELRSLPRASFQLDAQTPTITVEAAYSKNRQTSVIPLRDELTEVLREFLSLHLPTASAFTMPQGNAGAKMLRGDLEVADILYRDESNRIADFHSLRHSFISNLAKGGVHPKTAQMLARHSTITLTMDR